jgi:hypothetical protein
MTKSRSPRTAALALAGAATIWTAAASAQPGEPPTIVTAEEAIAMNRAQLRDLVARRCPPGTERDGEVVVCGRREGYPRYRLADPDTRPAPGTGERAGGEQLAAMAAGSERCSTVGRDQQCGGGLDIFGIGFAIVRGIAQALANRD